MNDPLVCDLQDKIEPRLERPLFPRAQGFPGSALTLRTRLAAGELAPAGWLESARDGSAFRKPGAALSERLFQNPFTLTPGL